MFDAGDLATDGVARVRLLTGDIGDVPILDDNVYEFQLLSYGNELDAAIECLENIISYITVNPQQEKIGNVTYSNYDVKAFEQRRKELINKKVNDGKTTNAIPVVVRSDRKSWCDFDFLKYK